MSGELRFLLEVAYVPRTLVPYNGVKDLLNHAGIGEEKWYQGSRSGAASARADMERLPSAIREWWGREPNPDLVDKLSRARTLRSIFDAAYALISDAMSR